MTSISQIWYSLKRKFNLKMWDIWKHSTYRTKSYLYATRRKSAKWSIRNVVKALKHFLNHQMGEKNEKGVCEYVYIMIFQKKSYFEIFWWVECLPLAGCLLTPNISATIQQIKEEVREARRVSNALMNCVDQKTCNYTCCWHPSFFLFWQEKWWKRNIQQRMQRRFEPESRI